MRSRNGTLIVEHHRLPIVDVAYVGPQRLDDIEDAFEEYVRLAERHEKLAWLVDMRQFNPLRVSATDRKAAAAVFHRVAPRLIRSSVAEARVISSPLTRGVVTAFDWLTGANKWPCQQFATMEKAEAWLLTQLSKASSA